MGEVVETLGVVTGAFKVDIVRRPDGLFQLIPQKWIEEIVPGHGKVAEFWEPQGRTASLTDDLEIARAIAREFLAANDPAFPGSER
jgi:hypothetical protein